MPLIRRLPLWFRYVVTFAVAAVLFIALVHYVTKNTAPLQAPPQAPNAGQLSQEQHQDRIVVEQQQAPHRLRVPAATPPVAAARAVAAYMAYEVAHGFIAGPVDGQASCHGSGSGARIALTCNIHAGSRITRLRYPFDVVVVPSTGEVTYCQVVTPPIPSLRVPVSPACR
ncbi:hypothetical protein [Conexibacter sp. DBS9H8]|uniref:hypothetical protein n=1 Tax=Conexibacter sp. DBS9H8 TaxID=2937801 RepID=UPI002010B066|nr:hypothetical protein [Conexibacter sp. DBS9H8]